MDLDALRSKAAELFPLAVGSAIADPKANNPSFEELRRLCAENFTALGFSCDNDCFSEVVPKVEGELTLAAWSRTDLEISGWKVNIHMRPFRLGASYAHFEIRHEGPMTGFSETGYRSHFTPLTTFAEFSPEEYLSLIIGLRPREQQLDLF